MLALGIILPGAGTTQAQPDEGPRTVTAGDRETARSLMDDGDAKTAAGDYSGALEAYLAADKIMGVPTTGIDLGRAQAKLGMLLEARDTWLRVARYPVRAGEPDAFTRARGEARALAKLLAGRIPSLQIEVAGATDDVPITVTVDGVSLPAGTHRFPRKVNPGHKTITATAPGYSEARQAVMVAEAEQRIVSLTIGRLAYVPEPTTSPLVYVGFGIGGLGLIAGTITGVLSLTQAADVKDRCDGTTCPRSAQEDIDSAKVLANVSNVAFAVGGVGVGLGILGLFLPGEAEPAQAQPGDAAGVAVEPLIGPGWAGLSGRF
ncbi:MAG: hypothetical protein JRI68_31815 [Deltaproteobacteria bacterium]|nr:hypothetical protein [Deltaproteobacteria bacterium]